MENLVFIILSALFTLSANVAVGFLYFWMKKTEARLQDVEHQLNGIRLNYLDRFDDIKDTINKNHLELIAKMVKLDTVLTQHIK